MSQPGIELKPWCYQDDTLMNRELPDQGRHWRRVFKQGKSGPDMHCKDAGIEGGRPEGQKWRQRDLDCNNPGERRYRAGLRLCHGLMRRQWM